MLLSRDLYVVSAALSNVVPCLHAPLGAGTWSMKAINVHPTDMPWPARLPTAMCWAHVAAARTARWRVAPV